MLHDYVKNATKLSKNATAGIKCFAGMLDGQRFANKG